MGSGSAKQRVGLKTLERVGVEFKAYLALRGWWWKLEFSTTTSCLKLATVQYGRDTVQFWQLKDLQGIYGMQARWGGYAAGEAI